MTHEPGSAARPGRRVLLVVLCLALAASIGFLVVRVVANLETQRPPGGGYGATVERADVARVAEQFALRMGTYGPKDLDSKGGLPAYRKRVGELLTAKFRASFDDQVELAEQTVAQAKLEVKATVNAVGVASLDGDRATALVAWEISSRYDKDEFADPRQTRSRITLVKIKDKWLVDDFVPVTGEIQ
jgi:Mce-associated membrane protein